MTSVLLQAQPKKVSLSKSIIDALVESVILNGGEDMRSIIASIGDTLDLEDALQMIRTYNNWMRASITPQERPRRSATRAQEHMCNIREHREKIKALEVLIEQEENAAFALMGNIVRH